MCYFHKHFIYVILYKNPILQLRNKKNPALSQKPMCEFSGPTTQDYEGFTWQTSQEKGNLLSHTCAESQHPSENAVKTQMTLSRPWREGEDPGLTFMFLNSLLTDLFPATPGPLDRNFLFGILQWQDFLTSVVMQIIFHPCITIPWRLW